MMRFPLRLTADLALARIAHKLRVSRGARPVQFVDAAEVLHADSSHPVSHEKMRDIIGSRSPVVWIGGSEPLLHPGIAHLVRAITQNGHFVFLETDGTLLRRRIHEFQPVSRLFLTVRLEASAQRHNSNTLRTDVSDLAMEGVRAARLSGFLICVQVRVTSQTEMRELVELSHLVHSKDADGIVISPASKESNFANPDAVASLQKMAQARKLIGSALWESFSRLIEPMVSGERNGDRNGDRNSDRNREEKGATPVGQESRANEEGVKVA
jgi:molybdenum cofactor biosynthesis enzyme MoaA